MGSLRRRSSVCFLTSLSSIQGFVRRIAYSVQVGTLSGTMDRIRFHHAVCRHLRQNGWKIISSCSESQRGDDIVARHRATGREATIEAKGETSSKTHTNRHGKAFHSGQASSHVSRAFYRAAQTAGGKTAGAIALPRTELHLDRVRKIECALKKLKLEVFWVDSRRRVTVAGIWPAEIRP